MQYNNILIKVTLHEHRTKLKTEAPTASSRGQQLYCACNRPIHSRSPKHRRVTTEKYILQLATIRYDSVYLACSKKLTGSHHTGQLNKKIKM